MDEIRIVSPGKTRGYPYPVCKKEKSQTPVERDILVQWVRIRYKGVPDGYLRYFCTIPLNYTLWHLTIIASIR